MILNTFPNKPWFLHVCISSNLKLSFANSFSLDRLNFVIRERVNPLSHDKTSDISKVKTLEDDK